MSVSINARKRILKYLEQVLDRGMSREQALEAILAGMDQSHRARWTSLFYGCLRSYRYLLPWIDAIRKSKGSSKKIPRSLELLLLMSAHQLRLMNSFPAYAVIQEGLKLIPKPLSRLKKYVGFLLREIERSEIKIDTEVTLPEWFKGEVPDVLGDQFQKELKTRLIDEPSSACYLPRKSPSSKLRNVSGDFYVFDNLNYSERSSLIEYGAVFGELLSISMPLRFLGEPKSYLDLCSAPGSKLSVALQYYPNCNIWAVEKNSMRYQVTMDRLQQNPATNRELNRLKFLQMDALDFLQEVDKGSMDFILLDAPCSALGTLLNHPEFLTYKSEHLNQNLESLQLELLRHAIPVLKPGGQLIYSVCTFRENESTKIIEQCKGEFDNVELVSDDPLFSETLYKSKYGQFAWSHDGTANQLFYFQKLIKKA